jgi:hypothetical protein
MLRVLLLAVSWLSPGGGLEACVSFWQRELGLQEWTIAVHVVSDRELGGRIEGCIDINAAAKKATIRVVRLEDSDLPRWRARAVQRYTVAHELMHLHLHAKGDPDRSNEKVVDTALVRIMRSKGRWYELLGIEGGIQHPDEVAQEGVAFTDAQPETSY